MSEEEQDLEQMQEIVGSLPVSIFGADVLFLAEYPAKRWEELVDLAKIDDDDQVIPLGMLGVDFSTSTPGSVLVPMSLKAIEDIIATFKENNSNAEPA